MTIDMTLRVFDEAFADFHQTGQADTHQQQVPGRPFFCSPMEATKRPPIDTFESTLV
ncbi:MAG: hypothetical protein SWH68_12055 [Thermodesulfobacteriota bacterium]|nr:hypothetical protein [Thermodesulfobacteriota bacterium]